MGDFLYQALDPRGKLVTGEFNAPDPAAVHAYLSRQQLVPLKIQDKAHLRSSFRLSAFAFERIADIDRIFFVRNLGTALKSGLDIVSALNILIADTRKRTMQRILEQARTNLEHGQPLSQTFHSLSRFFPPIFVGMIHAGEASGRLDGALQELNTYLTKQYELRKRIRAALAYPTLLLIASAAVIVLLLTFVLPRLEKTFLQAQVELPLVTRLLISLSNALTFNIFLNIAVVFGLIGAFIIARRSKAVQRFGRSASLRIPFAGDLLKKIMLVRITKTLGHSLASGIPIIEALSLAASAAGEGPYARALQESSEKVTSGMPLSQSLSHYPRLFPHFLIGLMVIGEKTGTLENVLKTFSRFYRSELNHALKNVTTYLEPLLLLCMGFVVGWIALSLLLPIYQLVGSFV